MWKPQSPGELFTQRQNNGQHTYNRAPHLPADRFKDTLLHNHGRPNTHGRPSDEELAANPYLASHYARWYAQKNRGFLFSFTALIGFFLAIPIILAAAYEIGLFANVQFGVPDLYAFGIVAVSVFVAPWLIRRVYRKGVHLRHQESVWSIPFKLVAFVVVAGVAAYYSTTWTWAFIDYFELAVAQQERLYWGVGVGFSWAFSVYLAFSETV